MRCPSRRRLAHDLDAVAARQHDVEDQQIERLRLRQKKTVLSGRGDADRVLVRFKALLHRARKLRLVFHHQNPHESNVKLFRLTLSSGIIQKHFSGEHGRAVA